MTLAAALVGAPAALGSSAIAAADSAPAHRDRPAAQHCVTSAETGTQHCYATYADALRVATHGRVDLNAARADDLTRAEVHRLVERSNRAATRAAASGDRGAGDVIGAAVYTDERYGGASKTITIGSPCTKDGNFEWRLDFPEGDPFRTSISSTQSWGQCWVWLFDENDTKAGPWEEDAPSLGSFGDWATYIWLS